MVEETTPVLRLEGVSKFFAGAKALDRVSLQLRAGEVHGLVGGNGAGKSTLMAVASGALVADEGWVEVAGAHIGGDPRQARDQGLAIVRQEPALMPDLTVAENLWLGVPARCRPALGDSATWAAGLLRAWREPVGFGPGDRVAGLLPEQRFVVEIVKALAAEPAVLVLDEPTEHLPPEDVKRLFAHIRALAARGTGIVYISHRIREVKEIADRLTVLRDGRSLGTCDARGMSERDVVALITGGDLDREFPAKAVPDAAAPVVLKATDLRGPRFTGVSLQVRRAEILGLAGMEGHGQRHVMRALAGLEPSRGRVEVQGQDVAPCRTGAAARAGIRYLPGDRHREGLFAELSVRENFSLRSLGRDLRAGLVGRTSEAARATAALRFFSVKTPGIEAPIAALSGGNQQKLVLASVLASEPRVLLVDEPTQGVDVAARMEIYRVLRRAAADGMAIIVTSSDAQEVAGLCDRVLIFSRGQVVQELAGEEVNEGAITAAAVTATTVRETPSGRARAFWHWAAGDAAPLVMLALSIFLLGAYAAMANEHYLTARNLSGVLPLVATLAIVACGQQLLMLAGGIDLSVGPLMGLAVVTQSFFLSQGAPPGQQAIGWVLVLAIACAVGLLNWLLVDPFGLHPMVATLTTYMGLQAVSLLLRPEPGGLIGDGVLEAIGHQWGFVPVTLVAAAALALLLEHGLFRRPWGLALRGFGSRPEAARAAGVKPRRALLGAYLGCSLLAAVAAVPLMAQVGSGDPQAGSTYTLASIAAVVIGGASLFGGRGSFVGALLGAALITQVGVVATFLGVGDAAQAYLLGAMILLSVALYSRSRQLALAT